MRGKKFIKIISKKILKKFVMSYFMTDILWNEGEKKALFQHSCWKNIYFSVMEIFIENEGRVFFQKWGF